MDSQKPSSSKSTLKNSSKFQDSSSYYDLPAPNLVHFGHLLLPNRAGTNLQFRPKVLTPPLNQYQRTLLDNLWCNRSDTGSMINALNCLNLYFSEINDQLQNLDHTNDQISVSPPTNQNPNNQKDLENEKRKNMELISEKDEFAQIILDITKKNLEQQFQYLYLPNIPIEIKNKLFQTVKKTKQKDMIKCQEKIRSAYELDEPIQGLAFSYQTLDLHNPCPCHFCSNHFQIVTISIHLAYTTSFYQWSIKNLLDYGLISKLIISRDSYLEEQISSLQHPGLQKILWNLFEDNDMFSITLLIKSVEPYFEDLMDTAKHIIEIIITPRSFKAEQKSDDHLPITENTESSLLHHRLYQIANLQNGIYRPRWHSHLAYQDKNMMVFLNVSSIRGKFYYFQFYCQQQHANLLAHIQTINWYSLRQSGDFQSMFQRIPPIQNRAVEDNNWFEDMDNEELLDMVNRISSENDNWR